MTNQITRTTARTMTRTYPTMGYVPYYIIGFFVVLGSTIFNGLQWVAFYGLHFLKWAIVIGVCFALFLFVIWGFMDWFTGWYWWFK